MKKRLSCLVLSALLVLMAFAQATPGTFLLGIITASAEELPTTPHITLEKTEFTYGEEIIFSAWGDENSEIGFFPAGSVPGKDPTIYWAYFDYPAWDTVIPLNTPVKVSEIPGNNKGNAHVDHYYGKPLPIGDYKLVIRQSGVPILQVDLRIVDELYIKDVTLTGTAAVGESLTVTGTVVNNSDKDQTFDACLSRPLLSTTSDTDSKKLTVKAHSTAEVSFPVTLTCGGGFLLGVTLRDDSGAIVATGTTHAIATGKGYYGGDAHTHSVLSDGKNTLKENFTAALNTGHAWMYATDHNYNHANTAETEAALKGFDKFLAITGNEITSDYGHLLEYGTPHRHPANVSGSMYESFPNKRVDVATWQAVMDEIIAEGGACYIAHPFFWSSTGGWMWPGIKRSPSNVFHYTGFTGIEVYNSDLCDEESWHKNRQAFELWDRYNLKGEQHYYGMANTDGHYMTDVAEVANVLMLDEMTPETILEALKTGRYYATNGPEMRFSITDGDKTANFGETLPLPADKKATLQLEIGSQDYPITKVILYKYTMTGMVDAAYNARVETVLFDSEKDGTAYTFSYTNEIDVADGQFYRVEVYAADSVYGDGGFARGLAFSNPIWVGTDILADKETNLNPPADVPPTETEPETAPVTEPVTEASTTVAETTADEAATTAETSTEQPGGCASTVTITAFFSILAGVCLVWNRRKNE